MLLRDDAAQCSCVYERQYYLCLYGSDLLVSVFVSKCTHARIRVFAYHLVCSEIVYSCCVPLVRGPEFRRGPAFCRPPSVQIHKRLFIRNQDLRCTIYYCCSCTIHIRVHLSIHPCVHTKPNAHTQQRRYPGLRWASFQWTSGESLSSAPFHRASRVLSVRFEEAQQGSGSAIFCVHRGKTAQFKSADMPSACPMHWLAVKCTPATAHRVPGNRGLRLLPSPPWADDASGQSL